MKFTRFLLLAQVKAGTALPREFDPMLPILTRVGMNRHSVESQALIRVCLVVVATEGDMVEPDLWALGSDARGLLNAFAVRRAFGEYPQVELHLLVRKLGEYREDYAA